MRNTLLKFVFILIRKKVSITAGTASGSPQEKVQLRAVLKLADDVDYFTGEE